LCGRQNKWHWQWCSACRSDWKECWVGRQHQRQKWQKWASYKQALLSPPPQPWAAGKGGGKGKGKGSAVITNHTPAAEPGPAPPKKPVQDLTTARAQRAQYQKLLDELPDDEINAGLRQHLTTEMEKLDKRLQKNSNTPEGELRELLNKQLRTKKAIEGKKKDLERLREAVKNLKEELGSLITTAQNLQAEIAISQAAIIQEDGSQSLRGLKRELEEFEDGARDRDLLGMEADGEEDEY
jgi:hypothetical protein